MRGRPSGLRGFLGLPGPRLTTGYGFSNKLFNISLVITTALSLLISDCLFSWLIFDTTSFALFCFCCNNAFLANLLRIAD